MKISFLDDEPQIFPNQYGGKARTIINLAKEFQKRPDVEEITILSRSILCSGKEFYWNNIKFIKLEDYSIIRDILDEASRTDILNIHTCSFTAPYLKGFSCKTIYHLHDVIYATSDSGSHLDKALGNNWSQIIAPSTFAANVLKSISWWTDIENKISVVPRGIDKNIFYKLTKPKALELLATQDSNLAKKVSESYPVIFFPHRFGAGKGEEFLEEIGNILSTYYRNPLILVTDQIQKNDFKNLYNVGWIKTENLSAYYSLSDICLVLSKLPETFSQVTIESVACQTPVIAFKYGNLSELSMNVPLVYLAEPTANSIIETIRAVLEDSDTQTKTVESLSILDSTYNLEKTAQNLINIYDAATRNNELREPKQNTIISAMAPRYFVSPNVAIYDNRAYVVNNKGDIQLQQLMEAELEILNLVQFSETQNQLFKKSSFENQNLENALQSLLNKKVLIRI